MQYLASKERNLADDGGKTPVLVRFLAKREPESKRGEKLFFKFPVLAWFFFKASLSQSGEKKFFFGDLVGGDRFWRFP